MSLSDHFSTLRSNLPRDVQAFELARSRRPELAPFRTPAELVSALDAGSPVSAPARYALVAAIVRENQMAPRPLWASVLMIAFAPMLLDLRRHLGREADQDRDQNVLMAFLEALQGIRTDRALEYATAALRRRTWRCAVQQRRADRAHDEHVEFDEEIHTDARHDPWGISAAEARIEAAWAKRREDRARAEEAKVKPIRTRRKRAA
jgi:hypothetical protein